MAENILDLDSLAPSPRVVKFGDKHITVNPPKTIDVLKLGKLGQKLEGAEDLADEVMESHLEELTAQVHKIIPGLEGTPLNLAQLLALVGLIKDMAVPEDAKELEKRKITSAGPKG